MILNSFPTEEIPGLELTAGNTHFPVTALDINGKVDGDGVVWNVKATFNNPLDAPVEASFTIPLPNGGAVVGMKMQIGDRLIEADIKEREEARIEYEEAKDQGYTAALFEQERAEIFTISIGNIHPGEDISVDIEVHDRAAIDGNEARLRMPTMIKQRFIPDDVPDSSAINPPRVSGNAPVLATVVIDFADDARDLVCETVPTAQITPRQVTLNNFAPTCDIVLVWTQPESFAKAKWVPDHDDADMGTLEVNIRVPEKNGVPRRRKAVQVMLDRSGSMDGHYLEWARRILDDLIASLTDDDLIHILAFDDSIDVLPQTEHGFISASRATKQTLREELQKIDARGGTDMTSAIRVGGAALSLLDDREDSADFERIAVLITDGAYGDEAAAIHHRDKNLQGARVIAVAIGENANGFLETLAANGICVFVSSQQGVATASAKVMSRVATAAHSNAQLVVNGLTDQAPALAPDIYPGVAVTLCGRMPRPLNGEHVEVVANDGLVVALPIIISEDSSATTRWAKQHISSLDYKVMSSEFSETGMEYHDVLEQEIVKVSVKFRVLSKYTAWIAVDRSRTTDQVIVRKLVQPQLDYDAFDSQISYSLNLSLHSPQIHSFASDPFIDFLIDEEVMQDLKSVPSNLMKPKQELVNEFNALLEKIDLYLTGAQPEKAEEILHEIALGIMLLLSEFKTAVIGKRVANKLRDEMAKMFDHDANSPETFELVTRVQAIITGHSTFKGQ